MKTATITLHRYSSRFINANYRIKAYGVSADGKFINVALGVSGALALIGAELLEKFLDRAERAGQDKCTCKLRRGLVITLYVK